jgi:hypothetical protein
MAKQTNKTKMSAKSKAASKAEAIPAEEFEQRRQRMLNALLAS